MRFTTVIATAMAASVAVAAPVEKRAIVVDWVTDVVTDWVTVYATSTSSTSTTPVAVATPANTPSAGAALQQPPAQQEPATTTTPPPPPPPPTTSQAPPPATTTAAPPPTSGSTTADYSQCQKYQPGTTPDFSVSPVSCGVSVIDTINQWRSYYGKAPLTWDATLAKAAWATVTYNQGGVTENHPGLADGSNGEVISPGFSVPGPGMDLQGDTPFGVAMVNWLCEVPSDPQLQASGPTGVDQCKISREQASIEENRGETGHHDIMLGGYTNIGCAFVANYHGDGGWPQFEGQYACDLN